MKTRHWICCLVDGVGLMLVFCAGLALMMDLYGAATAGDAQMMMIFRNCLMAGVAVLLVARCYEIIWILVSDYSLVAPGAEEVGPSGPVVLAQKHTARKAA